MALSSSLVSLMVLAAIFGVLSLGLNLKFGYTGLLDIGHVAFFLVGAYGTALLMAPAPSTQQFGNYILGLSWPWPVALAVATLVAGVFGLLVALPAIRLREDYLAISLLGISVIAQRIVQSEGWLANGPDSLRNYGRPLEDLMPLPDWGDGTVLSGLVPADVAGPVLLGLVVAVVYAGVAYGLAQCLRERETTGQTLLHALFAATTLGVGYAGGWLGRAQGDGDGESDGGSVDAGPVLGAGAVAGVVAAAGGFVGLGGTVLFVLLGAVSVFSWLFAGATMFRYYGDRTLREWAATFGIALSVLVAFLPVVFVSGLAGFGVTTVVFVGLVAGLIYLGVNWDDLGTEAAFVDIVGMTIVWLFLVRYFVIATITPVGSYGVGAGVNELLQNVLWLVAFEQTGPTFDYSRFLLVLSFVFLAGTYVLLQTTVRSPFGRTLKAIREDEDVATALGKNAFVYKIQSMMLGSAVAGVAGGLYAIQQRALTFQSFAPRVTFIAFLIVVIGGTASNRGAILGAFVYWGFWRATVDLAGSFPPSVRARIQALRLAVFGAIFVVILYYRPEGLIGERRIGGESGGGD